MNETEQVMSLGLIHFLEAIHAQGLKSRWELGGLLTWLKLA